MLLESEQQHLFAIQQSMLTKQSEIIAKLNADILETKSTIESLESTLRMEKQRASKLAGYLQDVGFDEKVIDTNLEKWPGCAASLLSIVRSR